MANMMSFNEFQRELQKRQIPENVAYMMSTMFEQMVELSKQGDMAAKIMLEMAKTMENLTVLSNDTHRKVFEFVKERSVSGVEVGSVANEPEKDN